VQKRSFPTKRNNLLLIFIPPTTTLSFLLFFRSLSLLSFTFSLSFQSSFSSFAHATCSLSVSCSIFSFTSDLPRSQNSKCQAAIPNYPTRAIGKEKWSKGNLREKRKQGNPPFLYTGLSPSVECFAKKCKNQWCSNHISILGSISKSSTISNAKNYNSRRNSQFVEEKIPNNSSQFQCLSLKIKTIFSRPY